MKLAHRLLALAMTFQVASAWALPTGVLCVADDGHLALKGADQACSHPGSHSHEESHAHAAHHHQGAEHSHGEGHSHGDGHHHDDHDKPLVPGFGSDAEPHGCHPCVDVTLVDAPPAQAASDDEAELAPPLTALHPAAPAQSGGFASLPRPIPDPPSPPPALRALRTVVLTC